MPPLNLRRLYGEYLEHSLRYYEFDHAIVPDSYFDEICQILLSSWPQVEHRLKYLTDESALMAGTGFQLTRKSELYHLMWLIKMYPDTPLKEVFGHAD